MVSKVFNRLTSRLLVLGIRALVAVTASSSAAARAGHHAAGDTHASSTLTVRNTRYGRILFDGRPSGRPLSPANGLTVGDRTFAVRSPVPARSAPAPMVASCGC